MSITISRITKVYGTQKALDDVSLSISPGEVVGLLGPNGAGKSTLMKILTCFIPPTTGEASVCGFDIHEQPLEVKRKVGYLPENNPLYPEMYVKEYLDFVAGIYNLKGRKQMIGEMIALTGLSSEQHKKIGALSKGFRQRVGLAQALIHDPEVLILDEPTSGLDPNQLTEIRTLIREIGKAKTVMLSTHIMQEVEAVCRRAIIIDKGRIIADDSTQNLSKTLNKSRTIVVEFSEELEENVLLSLPGVNLVNHLGPCHWEIVTDSGTDLRGEIFKTAVANNVAVLSMQEKSHALEEVFLALTRGSASILPRDH